MTQTMTELDTLGQKIDQIEQRVGAACNGIAEELAKPPAQSGARITGYMHDITLRVREMTALFPQLDIAQTRLSAEAARLAAEQGRQQPRLPPEWYALRTRSDRLRSQFNQWHQVQRLIRDQIPPRRTPLHVPLKDRDTTAVTQSDATDMLLAMLHRLVNPLDQDETAQAHGCFPDIMLSSSAFMAQAHAAFRVMRARRHHGPVRFLDVGCGSGFKVLSASVFFEHAEGLEFDAGYADLAQRIFDRTGHRQCRAIQGDALTFDAYQDYDILYFFRPMRDDVLMEKLERHILASARPGTLLIAPYAGFSLRYRNLGCAHLDGDLYLSASSEADATALREAAEYIGGSVSRDQAPLASIWEPVLEASHRNGYGTRLTKPLEV